MPREADSLTSFRHVIAAHPGLQARLGRIEMPDVFVAEALAVAAAFGIALDREALHRSVAKPVVEPFASWPPVGWLPACSVATGGAPDFDWLWFGRDPIQTPFYFDAARRMGFRPFARATRARTSLDTLVRGAEREATLAPDGLIFHMSRCGSTLAAQMLAAAPDHIVMSEAEPINAVVQWAACSGASRDEQVAALRGVVLALGRNRSGAARRYFLKLDAWHTLALPLFRAAFPGVPWLFLYRQPAEVMVSHARQPGMHGVPGVLPPTLVGVDPASATSLPDYTARVLARLCNAVVEHWKLGGGMLVHYPDLRSAMTAAIPAHFGFAPSPGESRMMNSAATRDAKLPGKYFRSDSDEKNAAVTRAIATAVATHLTGPYAALDILRTEVDMQNG